MNEASATTSSSEDDKDPDLDARYRRPRRRKRQTKSIDLTPQKRRYNANVYYAQQSRNGEHCFTSDEEDQSIECRESVIIDGFGFHDSSDERISLLSGKSSDSDELEVLDNEESAIQSSDDSDKEESEKSVSSAESELESSDVNCSDDNEDTVNEDSIFKIPLYDDSKLTIGGSSLLIAQFSRKYSLPRKGQCDLLKLLSLHCPSSVENSLPRSPNELLRACVPSLQKSTKCKVCSVCCQQVGWNDVECVNNHPQRPGKIQKGDTYFQYLALEPQLQALIKDNFCHIQKTRNLNPRHGFISDITNASLYQELNNSHHLTNSAGHVTLMMSTDGAPVFKSVHASVWPLYACVLELPPKTRYSVKNVLLLGLWYGSKKPDVNTFLEPTLQELNLLQMHGISYQPGPIDDEATANVVIDVSLMSFVADLPAKALVLQHKQYNGRFGCTDCIHPGKRLPVRGNLRVYPFRRRGFNLRTSEEMRDHACIAFYSGEPTYGVKGYSVLHSFMQIPDGIPIDYMHSILQGTGKWILEALVKSQNKDEPYYLTPATQREINSNLAMIKVPHDMDRKPRSLEFLKYWKASEIQHFLLYYGLPLLKKHIPAEYFHHLALLTTSLWILLKPKIGTAELSVAGHMLQLFCSQMKSLYGERSETVNVHSLLHLEAQVKRLGPLWSHSGFAFEAMIAHLLKMYKGTRGAADQMVSNYLVNKDIDPLKSQLQASNYDSPDAKTLSTEFAMSKPRSSFVQVTPGISFTEASIRVAHQAESTAVQRLIRDAIIPEEWAFSDRMLCRGVVFHSKAYTRAGKSCSFIVQISNCNNNIYGEVQSYVHVNNHAIALVKLFPKVVTSICSINIRNSSNPAIQAYIDTHILGSQHVPVLEVCQDLVAVFCESFETKCIMVQASDHLFNSYITPITDLNCK